MFIPIAKPENDYLAIPNLEKNFIKEFKSGIYVGGDNIKELESNLSKFLKVKGYFLYQKQISERF